MAALQAYPYVTYGPHENCTLDVCDAALSIYGYRPSLPVNAAFIALFGLSLVIQVVQGIWWHTWTFLFAMFWGCAVEMAGYGGRIMLWQNPFSFPGFLLQIICITTAPAYFSAAIYLTLSKIVTYLGPQYSFLPPRLYCWIFIPCDIVSLTLQAAGGGLSSSTSGASNIGVNVAIAGLSFQVFTLTIFILLALHYGFRYVRRPRVKPSESLTTKFKIFVAFLSLSILCILIRCIYRIDELVDGYNGPLIHNEGLFIGLEGVMIIIATFALNVAHPGLVFRPAGTPGEAEQGYTVSESK